MQINEIQQLNDNQQTHSSKTILDKIIGSGRAHYQSDCWCHNTPQFPVNHCFPADIWLVFGPLDTESKLSANSKKDSTYLQKSY